MRYPKSGLDAGEAVVRLLGRKVQHVFRLLGGGTCLRMIWPSKMWQTSIGMRAPDPT